ncbi:hypothetical protein GOV04_04735 [Candidatus Woesearchaeota archaeon]|nr:hypothetical protein [Candidatus Woesearchaeota archaeon]
MNYVETAFKQLYPNKIFHYDAHIVYSGQFKDYGANITLYNKQLTIKLSKSWYGVQEDIVIGCIQELLQKLFKTKHKTLEIDLYNNFIRSLHLVVKKDKVDPTLERSFNRINEKYFFDLQDRPNLVFGSESLTLLGYYEYKTDTVTISKVLIDDLELVDFVMYHELLHKKLKYYTSGSKTFHHTKEFKAKEREFENFELVENRLKEFLKNKKRSKKGLFSRILPY